MNALVAKATELIFDPTKIRTPESDNDMFILGVEKGLDGTAKLGDASADAPIRMRKSISGLTSVLRILEYGYLNALSGWIH